MCQDTNESRECTQIQIALHNHQSWEEWTRDNPEVIFELEMGEVNDFTDNPCEIKEDVIILDEVWDYEREVTLMDKLEYYQDSPSSMLFKNY
jgi:hypothetical protein